MTQSGLYTFGISTEQIDVLHEAFARIGMDPSRLSSWQMTTARQSLSFMAADWANRGPNLWAVSQQVTTLTAATASLTLGTNVIEVLEVATRTTSGGVNSDLVISPISRSEYLALNNKAQQGSRPTQYYFQRTITPVIYWWPVPQDGTVSAVINLWTMTQNPGEFTDNIDNPQRWYEAVASNLAWRLAVKFAPERATDLRAYAAEAYAAAAAEDTEIVPLRISPDTSGARWS